ncbi:MAG TPA: enoyl-CoA hydratase-related protein, partial [Steroidobacteraceae bacterium]
MNTSTYETLRARQQDGICLLQIHRAQANNTINERLIEECTHALEHLEEDVGVVVLEGLPEVF